MDEEKNENLDSQNQEEEEDTSETSTEDSTSTNEETDKEELKVQNKQLYERVKKAEEKAKREEAARLLLERKGGKQETKSSEVDLISLAKSISALKDYNTEELGVIDRYAKALGLKHEEAAVHEDVQSIISSKRERLKRENNTPSPTNKQAPSERNFLQYSPEDIRSGNVSMDEVDKFREWARNN